MKIEMRKIEMRWLVLRSLHVADSCAAMGDWDQARVLAMGARIALFAVAGAAADNYEELAGEVARLFDLWFARADQRQREED